MFLNPFFRQNFGGPQMGGGVGGPFRAVYQCYSAAFLPDRDHQEQQNNLQIQQTRGVPNYDYEYGTLQFLRLPLRSVNDENTSTTEKPSVNVFQPFSGEGQFLKKPRSQRPK
ncbi:unnamed protein product [Rotaria magnacalcarata]|uniref:Uncharacterized protein n=1 Tax=Rotaria magnacalcarata TaxID=392030 RepID=A0A8S2SAM8_9BILA|nr:unnamed protein product [Rotaria magnacalcarata]